MAKLFHDRKLRLVDGGVYDNQGVDALLAEGCDLILCSDGVGQRKEDPGPGNNRFASLKRMNELIMDQVRRARYIYLHERARGRSLRGLLYVHLKHGLSSSIAPIRDAREETVRPLENVVTAYGIHESIQQRLAEMRTDLDSFSEVEAYALMTSGYLMTEHELKRLDQQREMSGEAVQWGVRYPRFPQPVLEVPSPRSDHGRTSEQRRSSAHGP